MNNTIKQIGERLHGLRDVLGIPVDEIAAVCEVSPERYLSFERGEADAGVYRLSKISRHYGIALDVLLFGEDATMNSYFLTRRGQGLSVERRKDYKYNSLASGFRNHKVSPFMVRIDPLPGNKGFSPNAHDGQEFDFVTHGRLEITIGHKILTLDEGDSIYFDARQPHFMRAIGDDYVEFLCIVI